MSDLSPQKENVREANICNECGSKLYRLSLHVIGGKQYCDECAADAALYCRNTHHLKDRRSRSNKKQKIREADFRG